MALLINNLPIQFTKGEVGQYLHIQIDNPLITKLSTSDGSNFTPETNGIDNYIPINTNLDIGDHLFTILFYDDENNIIPEETLEFNITIEAPAETPVEAPAETPVEAPAETPVEAPAETPVETPAETPVEAPAETPVEAPAETPVETKPNEETPMSSTLITPEAEALIALNSSTIQNYIPKYEIGTETDTNNISVYPGSKIGFGPLSKSEHSASKADEFKIMSDASLASNPSAGYTGGRGTGNPDNFGKFPYRGLMTDLRGEFFPKNGDFVASTPTQYPLGRTADLLENAVNPVGFTQKDANGYSTTTTRGGANASPLPTSGFTF